MSAVATPSVIQGRGEWGDRVKARYVAVAPMADTVAGWTAGAPRFEEIISAFNVPPAVIDVASHEQDVRG